jgi:hypothetical protein
MRNGTAKKKKETEMPEQAIRQRGEMFSLMG